MYFKMFPIFVYHLSEGRLVDITKKAMEVQSQEKVEMAVKKKTKKEKTPPSQIKYEKTRPTVSARLPKEKRERLLELLRSLGITLPQLLLHFIDEYEIRVKPVDEARQAGYEEAKRTYMVTHPCAVCGKPIVITSQQAKDAASKCMTEQGWGHKECHEKMRLQSKAR